MNFKDFLTEANQKNDVLNGNTEIKHLFRSQFPNDYDIYYFSHKYDYQAQLPVEIIKGLDLKLVKENIINWNKSKTQITTEQFYSNGNTGLYIFRGTGLAWLKHNIGLIGTKSEDKMQEVINTLKELKIIK